MKVKEKQVRPDGTVVETELEGEPGELADYDRKRKEGPVREAPQKKKGLIKGKEAQEPHDCCRHNDCKNPGCCEHTEAPTFFETLQKKLEELKSTHAPSFVFQSCPCGCHKTLLPDPLWPQPASPWITWNTDALTTKTTSNFGPNGVIEVKAPHGGRFV